MIFSELTRQTRSMVAAMVLMLPATALAQEISDSHLAAARVAIEAIDATDQFDNILLNAATQIKSELIGNNPDRQTAISDMVDEKALALAPRRGDLENEIARVYAKLFTEEELRQIGEFYNSEAGKKLLAQGPLATREMLGAAEVWSNGIMRDLRESAIEGIRQIAPAANAAPAAAAPDAATPAQ